MNAKTLQAMQLVKLEKAKFTITSIEIPVGASLVDSKNRKQVNAQVGWK
jgi:hypothetical protein